MTKVMKEKLSNRLVTNFGILLAAGLVLLYVNSALRSGASARNIAYWVILVVGILAAALTVFLFTYGKKKPAIKNYSAVGLGVFIGCMALYLSKFGIIPGYTNVRVVIGLYIAMAVYFIVLAVITGIQLRKPTIKKESEKIVHSKKKKRK